MGKITTIVLLGGEGSRLKPLTSYMHKSLLRIKSGEPLLRYIYRQITKWNYASNIYFAVSKTYFPEQIRNEFSPYIEFLHFIKLIEGNKPLGTAGEIWNVRKHLKDFNDILVYYGDTFANVNLKKLYEQHKNQNADATVTLAHWRAPKGILIGDKIEEKPDFMVVCPVFFIKSSVLKLCKPNQDFMKDVIPKLKVKYYIHEGFYYDIGTFREYEEALEQDVAK